MTLSTPDSDYDEELGKQLLKDISDLDIEAAYEELRDEEIVAFSQEPDKPKPGRAFRYRIRCVIHDGLSEWLAQITLPADKSSMTSILRSFSKMPPSLIGRCTNLPAWSGRNGH